MIWTVTGRTDEELSYFYGFQKYYPENAHKYRRHLISRMQALPMVFMKIIIANQSLKFNRFAKIIIDENRKILEGKSDEFGNFETNSP